MRTRLRRIRDTGRTRSRSVSPPPQCSSSLLTTPFLHSISTRYPLETIPTLFLHSTLCKDHRLSLRQITSAAAVNLPAMAYERITSLVKHLNPGSALNQMFVTFSLQCVFPADHSPSAANPRIPTTSSSPSRFALPSQRPRRAVSRTRRSSTSSSPSSSRSACGPTSTPPSSRISVSATSPTARPPTSCALPPSPPASPTLPQPRR